MSPALGSEVEGMRIVNTWFHSRVVGQQNGQGFLHNPGEAYLGHDADQGRGTTGRVWTNHPGELGLMTRDTGIRARPQRRSNRV